MEVSLSESDIGSVKVGQPATVTVNAASGEQFAARVVDIGVLSSSSSSGSSSSAVSYPVTLSLDQTVGRVANKHGSTLYVKDSDGTTIRVKTASHSKINRTATASAGAIHPGDTVVVQGTKSSSATITATQINATSSAAASGLAALFGGGGGVRGFGGGGGGGAGGAQPPPAQPPGG
jgi:hypothetical protein